MEHSDAQRAAFRGRFRRLKRWHVGLFVVALAAAAAVWLFDSPQSLPALVAILAPVLALVVFRIRFWRCPACGGRLGAALDPGACPGCGVGLGSVDR